MVKTALFVRLEAKSGKEAEVERFLKKELPIVQEEPGTTAWFALRLGPATFGIFDVFPGDQGRKAHLMGRAAAALLEKAPELLAEPPVIQYVDVLSGKLPGAGFTRLKQKMAASKLGAALGLAGVLAAGWFAAKRYLTPSTRYEALQHEPVSAPL